MGVSGMVVHVDWQLDAVGSGCAALGLHFAVSVCSWGSSLRRAHNCFLRTAYPMLRILAALLVAVALPLVCAVFFPSPDVMPRSSSSIRG